MSKRLLASARALVAPIGLAVFAGAAVVDVSAKPQNPVAPIKPTAAKATKAEAWKTPSTPWGDPDFRGVFSNGDEYTTPLERPDWLGGRKLEDIKGEELATVRRAQLDQVIEALPGGRVRGPDGWWVQNLKRGSGGQAWMVIDPPDGRIPPLTPAALARGARPPRTSFLGGPFDGPEDLGLLDRCISRSVPGSMIPVMYGNTYEFVQVPGYVVVTYEIIHEARIIPLDGRPHVGEKIRQHMGDARGHFEGDTLVVETTNFTAAAAYRGANPATLRVTERFTRLDRDTIKWTATLDDPSTWTRPWTLGLPLTADHQPVMAFECHEGNYGMRNILSGARAGDRK
jgi:hypothetical protein